VSRLYIASVLALASVALQAQDKPTFRTGANYVRVDMYATLDGKSIEDLTAEEVDVLEDGVAQKVEAFEHVQVKPAGPQETRREPNTVEESRQMAAEARARVFVIFLDTYHTTIEGSANMRLPLIKFIDRLVGSDDMIALMTPEMGASEITLGRKTTVISNIMQAQWMWGRRGRIGDNDPKEDMYDSCYGVSGSVAKEMKARRREKLSLDALSDLMVHLGGVREERKALIVVTEGWQLFRPNANLTAGDDGLSRVRPEDILRRTPRPQPADKGTSTSDTRVECEADRSFESGDPEWSSIVLESFLIRMMRRVIGGDRVDRSVLQSFENRFEMFCASKRWRHLCIRVVAFDRDIREREVMWRDLARDVDAFVLRASNSFDRSASRNMRDVNVSSRLAGEEDVANSVDLFSERRHSFQTEQQRQFSFVHNAAG